MCDLQKNILKATLSKMSPLKATLKHELSNKINKTKKSKIIFDIIKQLF